MSGWRMVKPLTWISYTTVSAYRCQGRLPSCQLNAGSTTRLRGTCPAESRAARLAGVGCVLAEHLGPEGDRPADRLGVGVQQQLGRVAPQALGRVPGAADPVPVGLARADAGYERVPDVGVVVGHRDLGFRAGRSNRHNVTLRRRWRRARSWCPPGPGARRAWRPAGTAARAARRAGWPSGAVAGGRDGAGRGGGGLVRVMAGPFRPGRARRRRRSGPRRGGAGSRRRSGRSSRSGGRRRSRRRCRRGSTR